jgi:hypothetical protein
MNLNIVTQAAIQLKKEHCDLPNLISNSLYHTFLEQKAVLVKSVTLAHSPLSAESADFVENVSFGNQFDDRIELTAQANDSKLIVTVTVPSFEIETSSMIASDPTIVKAYRVGNYKVGINKNSVFESCSGKSLTFAEPVVRVFSWQSWNDSFQVLLYHSDGSLTRLAIDSNTADIQIQPCVKNNSIRAALLMRDAVFYCTYDGKLVLGNLNGNELGVDSLVKLEVEKQLMANFPEKLQVSDMKWDAKDDSIYILCNKSLIIKAHFDSGHVLRASIAKSLQGYFSDLELTDFGVIAKLKCNSNFSLLLKLQTKDGKQELIEAHYADGNATYRKIGGIHFMFVIKGSNLAIHEFKDLITGPRTISHRKFFGFNNYSPNIKSHCDNISTILPFKSSAASEIHSFAVFMENRKGFILKMNSNGILHVFSTFDMMNQIAEKSQIHLAYPLALKDAKGVEFLLLNIIEEKESWLVAFNIYSSEILSSFSFDWKLSGVKFIEETNMLVLAHGSDLIFYSVSLNSATRQLELSLVNKLEFETNITAFDFNGTTLVIADTRNSIHFFGITIKGTEIKPKYIAGDGKYRQISSVKFLDKSTVYLTTKQSTTALISMQSKSILKIDKKHERLIVKPSPGSPFNDLLYPFLKIRSEGGSLGYFAMTPNQVAQIAGDNPYFGKLFSQSSFGLVLDSRGKIYLCGSGEVSQALSQGSKEPQTERSGSVRSLLVVSNRLANFKHGGSAEINALKKIKEKSLDWNPVAKVNDQTNFADGPRMFEALRNAF